MGLKEKLKGFLALKGNIPVYTVSQFVSSHGWNIFNVVWQPYVLSLGASMPILGSLGSIQTVVTSGFQAITGRISDFVGRKTVQVASYALSVVGLLTCVIANAWYLLVPAVILFGLSNSLWMPAETSMVAESVNQEERGTAYSIISTAFFLPGFYIPIIGGYLAGAYGYSLTLSICVCTEVLSMLIFAWLIKETITVKRKVDLGSLLRSVREILKPKFGLHRFYLAAILDRIAWAFTFPIFFGMLTETYGFTTLQLGILSNVFNILTAITLIPLGKLTDMYGRKHFLILSEAFGVLLFSGLFFSQSFPQFILSYGLMGFVVSSWSPAYRAYVSDAIPEEERATYVGRLNALRGLIAFPSPFIGSLLYDRWGFRAPILTSLAFIIATLLVLITIEKR